MKLFQFEKDVNQADIEELDFFLTQMKIVIHLSGGINEISLRTNLFWSNESAREKFAVLMNFFI